MRSLKKYLLVIFAVLAIIFLLQKINWLPSFKNIFASKAVTIDETPVIVQQIRSLAQLITISYFSEVVMDSSKAAYGLPSLVSTQAGPVLLPAMDKLVIIGRGKVLAGTDLKELDKNNFHIFKDSVHLELPPAKILQTIINPSGFETFAEEGKWPEEAVTALKIKIRNEIEQNAINENILQQADQRSKTLMEDFLLNTGFKKVRVDILPQSP
jgi:Protein of unknown function (DUF4230)